jgi:hypothetical protein
MIDQDAEIRFALVVSTDVAAGVTTDHVGATIGADVATRKLTCGVTTDHDAAIGTRLVVAVEPPM